MPLAGTAALTELWAKVKLNFGRKIAMNTASTTVDVNLQNISGTTLSTGVVPAATSTTAGVMTAADKAKLDGIAEGATASDANTTYTLTQDSSDGHKLYLTGNDGTSTTVTVPDNNTTYDLSPYAKTASLASVATSGKYSDLTGTPTVDSSMKSDSTNAVQNKVVKSYIDSSVQSAVTGAVHFKGVVNAASAISGLTAYSAGWYWVVGTAGTYVGQTCEVGDQIFCTSAYSSAYSADDFNVLQANVVEMTAAEVDAICV